MTWADTPSGRQARWDTLQLLVDALWRNGFDLEIKERKGSYFPPSKHRDRIHNAAAFYGDKRVLREYMGELSKKGAAKGGRTRAAQLSKRRRRAIARIAARARWSKARVREIAE